MDELAPVGSTVVLLSDPSQPLTDRYKRLLRYVERKGRDLSRRCSSATPRPTSTATSPSAAPVRTAPQIDRPSQPTVDSGTPAGTDIAGTQHPAPDVEGGVLTVRGTRSDPPDDGNAGKAREDPGCQAAAAAGDGREFRVHDALPLNGDGDFVRFRCPTGTNSSPTAPSRRETLRRALPTPSATRPLPRPRCTRAATFRAASS